MPDGSWRKADILCPFFKHDSRRMRTISCEGVFDRSRVTHSFRRDRDWEQQLVLFCCESYRTCEIYRAVMDARYPDDDDPA